MFYVKTSDNAKIAVEDINPHISKTIVMVHGWPLSKDMFEYQKTFLNEHKFRIVSYDIRGFGDSDVTGLGYHYSQLAADLHSVLETLDLKNITLLGFSMGGAICVHYMNMFNNGRVSKLVLAAAAVPSFTRNDDNPYGASLEEANALIQQTYQDRPQMIQDFSRKMFALNHSQSFNDWFQSLCLKASGIGTIQTAISLRDENVYGDLFEVEVPTLIMHGVFDQICPFELALIMKQNIPHAYLARFEFSGHGLFYDEREKFNHLLVDFMNDDIQ